MLTGLRNNGKTIDLSQTWRQCGLSPGVKLELVESSRSPSTVTIALQLPSSLPGGRLVNQFRSDTTLWHILRWFEDKEELNITQRGVANIENGESGAGRINYEMPRLLITGRELSTFGDLQKTLAQLGFNSGSLLVRLGFRQTEQPLEEAMVEIAEYCKEQEVPPSTETPAPAPHRSASVVPAPAPKHAAQQGPKSAEQPTTDKNEDIQPPHSAQSPPSAEQHPAKAAEETVLGPNGRSISVIAPPSSSTPQAALLPHNESDYTPSLQHIKLHESRMGANTTNKRLLSDAEEQKLQEEKAAKLANITEVKIKISFPDEMKLVTTFTADDSAADLYTIVRSMIIAEDQPFKLVYFDRGTQTVPDDAQKKLIKHLGFGGGVMVNFHWADASDPARRKPPILKTKWAGMAKEQVTTTVPQVEGEDEAADAGTMKAKGKENNGGAADKLKGKMAKWTKGLSRK